MRAWMFIGLSLWSATLPALDLSRGVDDGHIDRPQGLRSELRYFVGSVGDYSSRDLAGRLAGVPWQPVAGAMLPQRSTGFYWFLLPLRNTGVQPTSLILEFGHTRQRLLNVYLIEKGRLLRRLETGSSRVFASRPLPHPYFLFPLTLSAGQHIDVLIQVQGRPAAVPDYLSLWTHNTYFARQAETGARDWLLLGLFAAIAGYQLAVFGMFRRWPDLACATHAAIGMALLVSHFGYGFSLLWPDSPRLDDCITRLLPVLLGISGVLFSTHVLALRRRRRGLALSFDGYCLLLPGLAITQPVIGEYGAGVIAALDFLLRGGPLCLCALAMERVWRNRDPAARLVAAGWAPVAAVLLLTDVDPLNIDRDDIGYQVALLAQVLWFALALAGQYNHWSRQRRAADVVGAAQIELRESSQQRLRTSLQAIAILSQCPAMTPGRRRLWLIERITSRLVACLDSADDAAALLQNRLIVHRIEFDPTEMVRQLLADAAPPAGSGTLLYGAIDPRLPKCLVGDAYRLRRLLGGLLERAVDAAIRSEVVLRLSTGGVASRSGLTISLRTTAAASLLDDDLLCLVSVLGGNSGMHNGAVAELWIWLPLGVSGRARPTITTAPGARVLLVYPNRDYRLSLARVMRGQGYAVDDVADCTAALGRFAASQRGDQRYDWLIVQGAAQNAALIRLMTDIRRRWPASATRLMLLLDAEPASPTPPELAAAIAVRRPLLCNDVAISLGTVDRGRFEPVRHLSPLCGKRVLVAAADRELRSALAVVLAEYGCVISESDTGRALEYRYRRSRRWPLAEFTAIVLYGDDALATEVRRLRDFEFRYQYRPVPLLAMLHPSAHPDSAGRLVAAGVTRVLDQSFSAAALIQVLTEWQIRAAGDPTARPGQPCEPAAAISNAVPAPPAVGRFQWDRQLRD